MKYYFLIVLLSFATSSKIFGQECDCLKNIRLLQQKIEDNQASYQHQVVEQKRLNEYLLFRTDINSKAKSITTKKGCLGLVSLYLSFFRDEHSFISYEDKYVPEPNKILKPKRKRNCKPLPFEGVWYFQDGSFSIDIFQPKNTTGQWAGVIKDDNTKIWKKGQIKIEFINNVNGSWSGVYWGRNLIPKKYNLHLTDSTMTIGRKLIFYRKPQVQQNTAIGSNDLLFMQLSERTNYLKIPSFDLSFKASIDSIILNNRLAITSKENLIIDLRNNGGGGFDAFQSILPYVLDTNVTEVPYCGSVWVSDENYAYYDRTKYEFTETKQDSIDGLKYVDFLKDNIGCFAPIECYNDQIQLDKNSPSNIAIVFNRYTASTAEGFILQASKSKKVQTYGENSAGAVSYGDWMPLEIPDLNIWVAVTTKKMVFKSNEDFESIGISPDKDLEYTSENEWLKIILGQMEK
jgi:hypothetical protein